MTSTITESGSVVSPVGHVTVALGLIVDMPSGRFTLRIPSREEVAALGLEGLAYNIDGADRADVLDALIALTGEPAERILALPMEEGFALVKALRFAVENLEAIDARRFN